MFLCKTKNIFFYLCFLSLLILFSIFLVQQTYFFDFFKVYYIYITLYFGILTFLNFFNIFFLTFFLGYIGIFISCLVFMFLFWLSLAFSFFQFTFYDLTVKLNLGAWFKINLTDWVYFDLYCDSLSIGYSFLTVTIALSVIPYTFSYFRYEPSVDKLIILINSFVFSMLILVNSGNLVVLFLGWELIGLTSFLLINFWNTRVATLKSAFKAFTFNKFSDVSLLIAIFLIFNEFGSISILVFKENIIFNLVTYWHLWYLKISVIELITFFILIASFIKSAQFGFHLWLPDSMEAPVPASALIHSATLVSAGVFLLLRFHILIEINFYTYIIIQVWGALTAFYGGFCAMFQSDIKRLLAYSTISHCGFLMVCTTFENFEITILYLFIHGFFKALSFLCVGNILRISRNYQDFRKMGNFFKYLPFEFFTLVVCLINLCGLPFTFGFFSKHLIFLGFKNYFFYTFLILSFYFFAALFGIVYCYRLVFNVFFDFKKGPRALYKHLNIIDLKSFFYTNTTLFSSFSIFFLLINSFWAISLLFIFYFYLFDISVTYNEYFLLNANYFNWFSPKLSLLKNFKLFNICVIFIIFLLVITNYKFNFFYYLSLENIFKYSYVLVFFFWGFYCV